MKNYFEMSYNSVDSGLSLGGGGQGFPPVTKNMAPGYFLRKIEEQYNQKEFLAV